ncbi:helix-turn-helix domain-containing protein [Amycolatopsis thermophila]|uniref:helix-turn-helix domain-containing protein n=1 Tax=Amycolatopsis thermophila TaxID=206084 RepID=UPI003520362B
MSQLLRGKQNTGEVCYSSELFNRVRMSRGWTGLELARRSGVSTATVSRVLAGKTRPMPETAQALARALGHPLSAFVVTRRRPG